MRTLILALMLGCGIAGTASAGDKRFFSYDDLKAISGEYDLSDGRLLTVSQRGRKLYVKLDRQPEIEVMPVGELAFEAPGRMRLDFEQYPNGVVVGVRLALRPAQLSVTNTGLE